MPSAEPNARAPWHDFKRGDHFVYLSARTGLLTWGEVIEDPSDPEFLKCRVFSSLTADGVEGDVTVNAIRCPVAAHDFEAARTEGWPDTMEGFLEFARKIRKAKLGH